MCKGSSARLLHSGTSAAQVVNNAGAWFNYVAVLATVERLAGERGLLVTGVVIVRLLPSLLLFPITGVVADR